MRAWIRAFKEVYKSCWYEMISFCLSVEKGTLEQHNFDKHISSWLPQLSISFYFHFVQIRVVSMMSIIISIPFLYSPISTSSMNFSMSILSPCLYPWDSNIWSLIDLGVLHISFYLLQICDNGNIFTPKLLGKIPCFYVCNEYVQLWNYLWYKVVQSNALT